MSSSSAINSLTSSTTSTTNSAISLSNILASETGATTPGIDVTAAVAAAIYSDRAPERVWQADQTTLSSQTSALTAIQTATQTLFSDMESLNTLTGPLESRTVTSSNSNYVTGTAATGTAAGVHNIVVNTLATKGTWYSDLATNATATLPTSSLTITSASGATATFATGSNNAGDNLNDLASAINNDTNLGVTASVVTDSGGARLVLASNNAGAANDFTVSTPSSSNVTSWTSSDLETGQTLGAGSITLTSSAGTVTINTTQGETYSQLAAAINKTTIYTQTTGFSSSQGSLSGATSLTAGTTTTITDGNTSFTYTAQLGDTVATLNSAIAAAVSNGTLSANVQAGISAGKETIQGDAGISVTTSDAVLGTMNASAGTTLQPFTATAGSDSGGTHITIQPSAASGASSFSIDQPAFGFTQANAATNATGTIDGSPFDSTTDTITGSVPGLTVNVAGATQGIPISLTVASDASTISTTINKFVSDYNSALNLVNTQFQLTSNTDSSGNTTTSQGVLASDPTVVGLQSALEQAVGYLYKPSSGTTTVSTLADLGINVNDDGTLSVDSSTLNNALTTNPTDVQNFFQGAALNGFANSFYGVLNTYTSPADGAFQVDLKSFSAQNNALTSEISDFETNYIASQQTILTNEFSQAEIALQSLPEQMQQLNAELGLTSTGNK